MMKNNTLLFILLAAAALYAAGLGAAPLWYDESGSVWMASLPWPQLLAATATDTHPPLYLLLLSLTQLIGGTSPLAMRLPSLLFALALVPVLWQLAPLAGLTDRARAWGVALAALSAWQLHYAQEARMYTLLQLLTLAALWALWAGHWRTAAVLGVAMMYTHNYGLFYWPALVLAAAAFRPTAWRPLAVVAVVPPLAFAPWFYLALSRQMAAVAAGYWIQPVTWGGVVDVWAKWLGAFGVPEWLKPGTALVATGGVLGAVGVALHHRTPPGVRLLVGVALVPFGLAVAASVAWKPVLLFRGLSASVPLLWLVAAYALDQLPTRPRLLLASVLLPVSVAAITGHYLWNGEHKTASQPALAAVRAAWQPGDVVLHANAGTLMEWRNDGADLPQYVLPYCATPNIGDLAWDTQRAMGIRAADPLDVQWERLWIVWAWPPTIAQCEVDAMRALLLRYPQHKIFFNIRDNQFISAHVYLVSRHVTGQELTTK